MNNPIYIGNGILDQIKSTYTYSNIITKESVFNYWMSSFFREFYEKYPYAVKWDYEKFLREILDYVD